MSESNFLTRREFVKAAGSAAAASLFLTNPSTASTRTRRRRYAMIGTGHRGSGMWGGDLVQRYSDVLEFVGLCDINPKRVAAARQLIGVECPTFTNFDEMMDKAK